MEDKSTKPKKRRRNQQTYRHKTNAVHVTLYDPHGETVPATVRHKAEQAILDIALSNNLLINIATT
jgi:hypothetical protein